MEAAGADLNEVMFFTCVVEAQGFTAAARRLGLPKSTVSRKVAQLERRLGVPLLTRTTRKLHLTDPGAQYYERCARIVAELDAAERAVRDLRATPKGTLRVTAPPDFALLHMNALVERYLRKYPEVDLVLTLTARRVDLIAEGIDLALRGGPQPADSSLVARKLIEDSLALFASPAYVKRHGAPRTPGELAEHGCIGYGREPRMTWKLRQGAREIEVRVKARICADDMAYVLHSTIEGRGIALLPIFASQQAVKARQLVRVLPDVRHRDTGAFYVVYPSARGLSTAARAFVEMTAAWIQETVNHQDAKTPR